MKKWLGIAVIFSSLCVGCAEIAYDALDFSVEGKFLTDWENCSLLAEAACQGGIGSDEVEALARCFETMREDWAGQPSVERFVTMFEKLAQIKDELVSHPWTGCMESEGLTFVAEPDGKYVLARQRSDGAMRIEDEGMWTLGLGRRGGVILHMYHAEDTAGWHMEIRMNEDVMEILDGGADETTFKFRRQR